MGNRLYVGNLSFNATSESVREWFAGCGTVTDVHVVTDRETGRSRGFAFVTMSTDAEAQKAISETNRAMMDGRSLRVNAAALPTSSATASTIKAVRPTRERMLRLDALAGRLDRAKLGLCVPDSARGPSPPS